MFHIIDRERIVTFVSPMPFNFMRTVVESTSDEKLRWALALSRGFAFPRFDRGLSEWVAGYFGGDYGLLDWSVDCSSDSLFCGYVLATNLDGTVFRDCCVDGPLDARLNDGSVLVSRDPGA